VRGNKGLKFSGFFAWFLWRSFISASSGLERKVRVVGDWTIELFFPATSFNDRLRPPVEIRP